MKRTISVLVYNHPGVLSQISGLFAARSYNIDSLAVGRTENPEISRMTIVVLGDDKVIEQVCNQLNKLLPVVEVSNYSGESLVQRDLMLVRFDAQADKRVEIQSVIEMFEAKVVEFSVNSVMVQIAGAEEKLEAFLETVADFGIKSVVRTGTVALPRKNKRSTATNTGIG
jgi:acetolactate synthase-1/3 small subunit